MPGPDMRSGFVFTRTQPQPLPGLADGEDAGLGGMLLDGLTAARAAAALLATAVATAEAVDAEDACADPGPASTSLRSSFRPGC